jgi:hypothetical protein
VVKARTEEGDEAEALITMAEGNHA